MSDLSTPAGRLKFYYTVAGAIHCYRKDLLLTGVPTVTIQQLRRTRDNLLARGDDHPGVAFFVAWVNELLGEHNVPAASGPSGNALRQAKPVGRSSGGFGSQSKRANAKPVARARGQAVRRRIGGKR